ncbi:MAG: UDP-N-acetylmuramate--L-alanine ligase [Anaerolineales bacterium]
MTKIHFIGIGGTGLSAIAMVMLERGFKVSGSDRQVSPQTKRLQAAGVDVYLGHSAENISGADIVLRSSAIPDDNVEVLASVKAGIQVMKRADFLSQVIADQRCVAIAGTHGKTTTTAMIAWILSQLKYDPSYIIGSESKDLCNNAHAGRGNHFIIEADEYDCMFLGLQPYIAVVTSVEHDHPDCFPTSQDFYHAFLDFLMQIEPDGALLVCGDDPGASRLLNETNIPPDRSLVYGISDEQYRVKLVQSAINYDFQAKNLVLNDLGGYNFEFVGEDVERRAKVSLQVPGIHNVRNATAALAVSDLIGVSVVEAASEISRFRGTERRFEVRGEAQHVTFIDDYAHHPTEIMATLSAARMRFPNRNIWAVWQPHTYSRTRTLFTEFAGAFRDADHVLVTDVYAARESAPENGFSAEQVVEAISNEKNSSSDVHYVPGILDARDHLLKTTQPGDVVIVLSAGDANQIIDQSMLVLRKQNQSLCLRALQDIFGDRVQENVPLARFTAARIGGPADVLLEVNSSDELAQAAALLWKSGVSFIILGGGSNILVSDSGIRGVVVLNKAKKVMFDEESAPPTVWAESGVNFGVISRQTAQRGLSGLEWAAGIPGTLGGAVVGNAGAHGGEISTVLKLAEILHRSSKSKDAEPRRKHWPVERFGYSYRNSVIKRYPGDFVVLSAVLELERSDSQAVQTRMKSFVSHRHRTQPPGASMGSMFKNPPGDYAGHLIEAVGLKGTRIGGAEISSLHANFFINQGSSSAGDVWELIQLARKSVARKFGVELELEIELVGEWSISNSVV